MILEQIVINFLPKVYKKCSYDGTDIGTKQYTNKKDPVYGSFDSWILDDITDNSYIDEKKRNSIYDKDVERKIE